MNFWTEPGKKIEEYISVETEMRGTGFLGKTQILEMLAGGNSLKEILDGLMDRVESQLENACCCVLVLNPDENRLDHLSGPTLPKPIQSALHSIPVNSQSDIFGITAAQNESLCAENMETDPRCAPYKNLSPAHHLRGCWTTPVRNAHRKVLGVLCRFFDSPRLPDQTEIDIINHAAKLAGIAIQLKWNETAHQKIEQDLLLAQEEAARFGRILDNSSNEIYYFDATTLQFSRVNHGARKNLGYSMEELSHMTPVDLKPEYTRESFTELIQSLRQNEKQRITFQTVHQRKNGTTYPIEARLQLMSDEGPPVFVAIIEDITERKKSELLNQSQSQILEMLGTGKDLGEILHAITRFGEALCDHLVSAVLIKDPETNTMYYASAPNLPKPYVEALNGFKIGPSVPSCGSTVYYNKVIIVEDIEKDPLWKPYLHIARANGVKACWSIPIRDSKGNALGSFSFHPHTRRKPSDRETKIINTMVHLAGIAIERKQVEKQMKFIHHGVCHAGDEAFWVDFETAQFVYVNDTACKSLGYTQEELLTMTPFDIDIEAHRENWPVHQEEMLRNKTLTFESFQKRKDGTTFPVELTSHLVDYEGKKYIITFGRDISDRKKNEAELIQARDIAEKANQAKSDFLSRMSHELRTPMNAILGFAQIMNHDPEKILTRQYRENIYHILKAGQHLKLLIDEVLDLAVVESGKIELTLENLPIGPVIREIISQMEPLRRAFDIQITTDNLTDSEHIIQADRMRFMQILINLMSNAIKYNRKGGRVTVSVLEEKNRKVSIRIQDTGVGITEEKLESIFEPFNRLNFEFGEIEGTGIGLNITKELVERMGGTIHVKSKVNEGSSFIVSFPSTDNSATESTPEDKRIEGNELLTGEEQVKILCVEDSPINLHLIEKILKTKPNFTLLKSQTAELGIELAQKEGPDIILMDIRLPGIDGFAAFDKLRSDSRTQSIPVIAVTAHAMPEDIRKAEKMGFNAYLTKPLDVDVFFKTLEELCRKD